MSRVLEISDPMKCVVSFSLALILAGCGGRSVTRGDVRLDGAADLRDAKLDSSVKLDGNSPSDTSAGKDSESDRSSTTDLGSSPDRGADLGIAADLSVDTRTLSDLNVETGNRIDLGSADTARDVLDAGVEVAPDSATAQVDGGCALATHVSVDKLPTISFTAYHNEDQIIAYLKAVAAAVPTLAQYKVLGQSGQGRDVPYLVINATCQTNPPAIFANGAHHGDEPPSVESVLSIPDHLLRKSTTDTAIQSLLATYAFYVLPVVNPDGLALNTRTNANGADINRDYSYPERSDANSFKTVEAQLIKALQESVGFHSAIAYHSGAQEVVWPWCYTSDATTDDSFFTAAGANASHAMGFTVAQQSYDDYPTQGEYIDYAYWKSRTLAATFEVSTDKTPSTASLANVVANAWKGTLAWVQAVSDHDKGLAHIPQNQRAIRQRFPLTAPFDGTNRLE
jgi:hypothetical protein